MTKLDDFVNRKLLEIRLFKRMREKAYEHNPFVNPFFLENEEWEEELKKYIDSMKK